MQVRRGRLPFNVKQTFRKLRTLEKDFFLSRSDLHRTFPDNILFRSEASLQSSLFNVLVAYGHHNKAVGYCQVTPAASASVAQSVCPGPLRGRGPEEKLTRSVVLQGMNFIAGYLIIITKDEEKSFWLMEALLARLLPGIWVRSKLSP